MVLEISRLTGFYGNSCALQGIDLQVDTGRFLSVLGRNGVGKTTLMRAMLGLLDRTEGEIRVNGRDLSALPTHERARAGIGYVPQGRGILPRFTVAENLALGGFARTSDRGKQLEELVYDMFPILREFRTRAGGNLSGGQQQQLAIARALMTDPSIILLDEPAEGVQPNIVELIEEAILSLNRRFGITIVLVEQNIQFARRVSSDFAILEKGRVVAAGPVEELTDDLVHRHMAV
jgi:urea transport system ATP-binding protein